MQVNERFTKQLSKEHVPYKFKSERGRKQRIIILIFLNCHGKQLALKSSALLTRLGRWDIFK